jgi:hypothetical protein
VEIDNKAMSNIDNTDYFIIKKLSLLDTVLVAFIEKKNILTTKEVGIIVLDYTPSP